MIRRIQKNDAQEIFSLVDANRNFLREWLPWLDHNTSVKDTEKFISDSIEGYTKKKSLTCVIIENDIVGICGFNSINHSIKAGYIGYWLSKD